MTLDEYNTAIQDINKRLIWIAEQTANQALAGCADPSNPRYQELMKLHATLSTRAAQLAEQTLGPTFQKGGLSDADHRSMDHFLGLAHDRVRDETLERFQFIHGFAHLMAALDTGNTGEAVQGFKRDPTQFARRS